MSKRNKYNSGDASTSLMAKNLDELAEFEEFQTSILPKLREAIKEGKSAEEIYKMATAAAAGKIATMAIKEQDPIKALALCKELLDRSGGKATERKEIRAQFSEMRDEDLDDHLLANLEEMESLLPTTKAKH